MYIFAHILNSKQPKIKIVTQMHFSVKRVMKSPVCITLNELHLNVLYEPTHAIVTKL